MVLFKFPLHEPALVERESDVDAECVFFQEAGGGSLLPLTADIEHGTVVVAVFDGNAEASANGKFLGAVLAVHLHIRRGIREAQAVTDTLEKVAAVLVVAIFTAQRHF